eukprot:1191225-Prorocentrum_minimum.AAC.1
MSVASSVASSSPILFEFPVETSNGCAKIGGTCSPGEGRACPFPPGWSLHGAFGHGYCQSQVGRQPEALAKVIGLMRLAPVPGIYQEYTRNNIHPPPTRLAQGATRTGASDEQRQPLARGASGEG